jgi:DtxR family Mn-dependent transcriptional regulator
VGDFHPATEEYLETILELEEAGIPALRARIVERLGVSAPSVSETVARLEREGYVVVGTDRLMRLTETGRRYATSMVRRHRLAERLLVDVLKVPWHQVHEEACRLEHAISERLEQHLVSLLGDPATCPHGNAIPGSANARATVVTWSLADAPGGADLLVHHIDEELESDPTGLKLLEDYGVLPERTLVTDGPDTSGVRITNDHGVHQIPDRVARRVYVAAGSAAP